MVTKNKITQKMLKDAVESMMRFNGLKDSTKRQYRSVVNRYLYFTDGIPDWSRSEIMEYMDSLGEISNNYGAWILTILQLFHKAVEHLLPEDKKRWPIGPREGPRVEVKPQPTFKESDIVSLLKIITNDRDVAIVRLAFVTGMRREEVCRLMRDNYSSPNIRIEMAKGEETRTVRLDKTTCLAINAYLETREDDRQELFLNLRGGALTPDALTQSFQKYFRRMKTELGTGFHAFRRGVVTLLHNKGLSETEIQKWGGWHTGEMVRRYIQLTPSQVGEKVEGVHPFYSSSQT